MARIKFAGAKVAYPVALPAPSSLNLDGADDIGTTLCKQLHLAESSLTDFIVHELRGQVQNFSNLLVKPRVQTLDELIEFNRAHADRELPPSRIFLARE